MAGHGQLKFVMTECSKTQIRLTRLKCVSVSSISNRIFLLANSEDTDQTLRSAASDLGLHCLSMSQKWDIRLICIKFPHLSEAVYNSDTAPYPGPEDM